MGNCMGGDDNRNGYSAYFQTDLELQQRSEIYKPLPTSLFNTLRRPTECAIIAGSNTSINEDVGILQIDFKNASPNSLKTLLNFKKVVYIGSKEGQGEVQIQKIKSNVSYGKFYVVAEGVFRQFLQDYPIFIKTNWQKHQMSTNKLPLMLVDSKEFVHTTENRIRLFIHASGKRNAEVYGLLGVKNDSMIIKEPSEGANTDKVKLYYTQALTSMKENLIVLLHSPSMASSDILETVAVALHQKYKIPINFSQIYLKRSWPNSNAIPSKPEPINNEPIAKTASIIESGADRLKKLFQKLQGESNEQKTERAYNLLSTLLINIYSNPTEDSYRQVKRANRQMNDLLIKYKNGLKLLDQLGFREKGEHWVNTAQTKYLKIFKTDLDLGFKRYRLREEQ